MKKYLLLASVAALAFTSCSDQSTEFVGAPESHEIAFAPLVKPNTRAAVVDAVFPTTQNMSVAAYQVSPTATNFFDAATFTHFGTGTLWKGGKYWPLSAAKINFLAYTPFTNVAPTWGSPNAASVELVMSDNSTNQNDLMFAKGTGEVTFSSNALTYPTVSMEFKHAQSLIIFNAKAYDETTGGKITLNSIKLNGAKYAGKFTVTHANYNSTETESSVLGAWDLTGISTADDVVVPNWNGTGETPTKVIAYASSGNGVQIGDGLMIVPDGTDAGDFTSFTINYTLDGKTYNYTYTPTNTNVVQQTKYIYNISFKLSEIEISATVDIWDDGSTTTVPVFYEP